MRSYIGGIIYIIWMFFICYSLGGVLTKKKEFAHNILIGYFFYTFALAVGLIIIQLLNLPWIVAFGYFCIVIITILFIVFKSYKGNKTKITKEDFLELIRNNYALIFISFILLFFSFSNVSTMWLNNHLDDGYYIGKIANLSSLKEPYHSNYAVGIESSHSFSPYLLNTWELESSIYISILKINVFVFCRVFLNFFNYFLFVVTVYEFAGKFFSKKENSEKLLQWIPCVLILFTLSYNYCITHNVMIIHDYWQFNSAMYLGSSIPRLMGFLWVIIPFLDKEKIELKDIIFLGIISVVLLSKSSIALPIVFLSAFSVFVVVNFKRNKQIFLSLFAILVCLILGFILPEKQDIYQQVFDLIKTNLNTVVFKVFAIIFVLSLFKKDKYIYKLNMTFLIFVLFMIVPFYSNLFENLSMYYFVGLRVLTCFLCTFYIANFVYLVYIVSDLSEKFANSFIIAYTICMCGTSIFTYYQSSLPVFHSLWVCAKNYEMAPKSTIELGKELDELSNGKKINVLMPQFVNANSFLTSLSTIITSASDNVISVSSLARFGLDYNDHYYSEYGEEDQKKFEDFNITRGDREFRSLQPVLDKYKIRCFILEGKYNVLNQYGNYKKVGEVNDDNAVIYYSIFLKSN